MPYIPLSQAELIEAVDLKHSELIAARSWLSWFYVTGYNTGLRGAEIINLPKLILEETATHFLVKTYKGSANRLISKVLIAEPLLTYCIERNYEYTLWKQKSFANLILNMNQEVDLWYIDIENDSLSSRLLTHQYRIRLINELERQGRSIASIAARMGITEATVNHYLSMQFYNTAAH